MVRACWNMRREQTSIIWVILGDKKRPNLNDVCATKATISVVK